MPGEHATATKKIRWKALEHHAGAAVKVSGLVEMLWSAGDGWKYCAELESAFVEEGKLWAWLRNPSAIDEEVGAVLFERRAALFCGLETRHAFGSIGRCVRARCGAKDACRCFAI